MPVWHEATKEWAQDGRLAIVGVTHEQHAQRCRLFAQWHEFDWPILHDPINLIEALAVPIAVAIDEHGIVRATRPRIESFETEFLNQDFADDAPPLDTSSNETDIARLAQLAKSADTADAWRALGDAFVLWGEIEQVDAAIEAYQKAITRDPQDGNSLFRLGVCYRRRYESTARQPGDFQAAVDHWQQALAIDPNQYIWRRRIQQYGPRLTKPYPFYDWIERARDEIAARGQQPVELPVSLSGAEIARPQRAFTAATDAEMPPDPNGLIHRDEQRLIQIDVSIVPRNPRPGEPARVHVALHTNTARGAHWNNESEPLALWIEPPDGWQTTQQLLTADQPLVPESRETRRLDFEIRAPLEMDSTGRNLLKAHALYYVCEEADGTCLYLRQDITIDLD